MLDARWNDHACTSSLTAAKHVAAAFRCRRGSGRVVVSGALLKTTLASPQPYELRQFQMFRGGLGDRQQLDSCQIGV